MGEKGYRGLSDGSSMLAAKFDDLVAAFLHFPSCAGLAPQLSGIEQRHNDEEDCSVSAKRIVRVLPSRRDPGEELDTRRKKLKAVTLVML
jgi:hypothetical protein